MKITLTYVAALITMIVASVALAACLAVHQWKISNKGHIITIGIEVYKDEGLTTKLEFIDWGQIYPGESKVVDCWIKNTKTEPVTLSMLCDNYNPLTVEKYLTTSWNVSTSSILQPQQVVKTYIILTISVDAVGVTDFTYDIIIIATAT